MRLQPLVVAAAQNYFVRKHLGRRTPQPRRPRGLQRRRSGSRRPVICRVQANASASCSCPNRWKGSTQKSSLRRHPIKIATNHLRGNRKPKMMPHPIFCRLVHNFILLKRRLQRQRQGFIQMINTLTRATTLGALLMAALLMNVAPAFSQAPSQAQRDAIKSECRSDYIAHCSSVPPGGEASLQCLQKNMSSLSAACQGAVRAVEAPAASAPAAPKAGSAPAAATAKPAAAAPKAASGTAAKQPSSAQASAIKSACRSDYPKVCAGVPAGGAPALQCLEKNKARLSPACGQAVAAASGG